MSKVLVYSFQPFGKEKSNISKEIVKRLKVDKIILTVVFSNKRIIGGIKKSCPEIILGLGQCPRGSLLRIERRALNKMKKDNKYSSIVKGAPHKLSVNLKIKKLRGIRLSYNAGEYVCNFILYNLLYYVKRNKLKTKVGFIHIPKTHNLNRALNIINSIIKNEAWHYDKA